MSRQCALINTFLLKFEWGWFFFADPQRIFISTFNDKSNIFSFCMNIHPDHVLWHLLYSDNEILYRLSLSRSVQDVIKFRRPLPFFPPSSHFTDRLMTYWRKRLIGWKEKILFFPCIMTESNTINKKTIAFLINFLHDLIKASIVLTLNRMIGRNKPKWQ